MILKDKAYEIARNCKYGEYQRALANMAYKFFDKKKTTSGAIATGKVDANVNEKLAEVVHKPVIKKFKRRKVYSRIKDNIWVADLAEMG